MPPARRASLRDSRRAGIAQNRRVDVKDIGFLKGAGIEYDEVGFSEIAIDAVKDTEDIFVIRDVGSIRTNVATSFGLDQVSQPRFVTSDRCDLHVLCRETPCQGPAKTGAYTGDDRRFARWHFRSLHSLGWLLKEVKDGRRLNPVRLRAPLIPLETYFFHDLESINTRKIIRCEMSTMGA